MIDEKDFTERVFFRAWLVVSSVTCGALVMTIEVLGSRVIGPLFGASLFVWTSLIAVTLLSLAVGYATGGLLADRSGGSADLLYALIAIAGGAVLLLPFVRGPVLRWCVPIGLRLGAFTAALALFGLPLLLLGTVSPFVVRLATKELRDVGWTVGMFSAISTFGSLAGTIATGFFLIPSLGVAKIFFASGATLLALAAGWFAVFRRKAWAALLLLPVVLSFRDEPLVSKVQANGTNVAVVVKRESAYGELKVVEYSHGGSGTRELMIDGLIQGGVDRSNGASIYEYSYFLSRLSRAKCPTGRSALAIGLGAGVVPKWLEGHGVKCDVIEIDPEIVKIARDEFGFRHSGRLYVEDARACLSRLDGTWDYIVLDVFGGDTTPGHLLSRESLALIKPRLGPGGVLAANLIVQVAPDRWLLTSVVETLRTVFDVVEVNPIFDPSASGPGFGNVIIIAYDGPRRPVAREALLSEPVHPMAAELVNANLGREWHLTGGEPYTILSDDYNPVDFYDRRTRERIRQAILNGIDFDVLL